MHQHTTEVCLRNSGRVYLKEKSCLVWTFLKLQKFVRCLADLSSPIDSHFFSVLNNSVQRLCS